MENALGSEVRLLYSKATSSTKRANCAHRRSSLCPLPSPSGSSSLGSMNTAQTQCPMCKKKITLTGYSQHVAKTQHADCHAVHALSPSLFRTGPGAASQSLVDLGMSQAMPNALAGAVRSPADYQMHIISRIADPNISVPMPPSQAWTNGIAFF